MLKGVFDDIKSKTDDCSKRDPYVFSTNYILCEPGLALYSEWQICSIIVKLI